MSQDKTRISLHPLSFDEAIKALVSEPKHKDSPAEGSCSTKEAALESEPSKPKTVRRRKSS